MNLNEKLREICKTDDLDLYIQFSGGCQGKAEIGHMASLVSAYAPPKISSYINKHGLIWDADIHDPVRKIHQRFFDACTLGDTKVIERMIADGFDYYVYNPEYIHIAIEHNHLETAKFLLKNHSKKISDSCLLHTYIEQYFQVEPDFDLTEEYQVRTKQAKEVIHFLLEYNYDINYIRHTKSQYGNKVISRETVLDIAYYWQRSGNSELGDLIEFLKKLNAKTLDELEAGLLPWRPILGPHD